MTESNRSGAAHDGARAQGKEAEGAPDGPARLPFPGPKGPGGLKRPGGAAGSGPVRDAPVRDAPVSWPGQATGEAATAEGTAAEVAGAEATGPEAGRPEGRPARGTGPARGDDSAGEPSAGEPSAGELSAGEAPSGAEPPAGRTDPPKPEWKPVVRPAGDAGGDAQPGLGQRGGSLAQLAANPRMRIWQLRAVVAVVILGVFWYLVSWKLGLTLAIVAIIADTIYRARKAPPARSG